jgi:photosystem II stability/assembly factor-like uncharacterized protein
MLHIARLVALSIPFACAAAHLSLASPSLAARFERVGPFGGSVRSLLINPLNPEILYLGTTDGQIYRSADSGQHWSLLHPGIGRRRLVIDTLVQHPADPHRVFAGGWDLQSRGGGLYESRDDGNTWSEVKLPDLSPAIRGLAVSARNPSHMIAGSLNAAFLTSDGGATWTSVRRAEFHNLESVAIDPVNPRILYIGTWRLAYRSSDFGRTWTRLGHGMLLDSDVFSLSVDPRETSTLFAGACSGIYRSTNGGASWKRLRIVPSRFTVRAHVVSMDPHNSRRIFGGTTEGLFISDDRGDRWTRATPAGVIVHGVQVDPRHSNRIFVGTEHHGVLRSDDGGRTWQQANQGFAHHRIFRIVPDPGLEGGLLAGVSSDGSRGGIYSFDQNSGSWKKLAVEELPPDRVLSLLFLPGNKGRLAGTVRGLYHQNEDSTIWKSVPGTRERIAVRDLTLDPEGAWIFAATDRGVWKARTADMKFETPGAGEPGTFAVAASRIARGLVLAAGNLGVLLSRDNGVTWQLRSAGLPERVPVQCIAACPAEIGHVLAGTAEGLFESRDGGDTWSRAADGRLSVDVPSVIFLDDSGLKIMAADNTFGGVFLSGDGGASWARIEAPDFGSPVRHLVQDPRQPSWFYLGTGSDGIYRLRLGESGDTPAPAEAEEGSRPGESRAPGDTTVRNKTPRIYSTARRR